MSLHNAHRTTVGVVDRIEPTGVIFVHEKDTCKLGFLANTTPVSGHVSLRPGTVLSLEVEDRGDVMVVTSARASAD